MMTYDPFFINFIFSCCCGGGVKKQHVEMKQICFQEMIS